VKQVEGWNLFNALDNAEKKVLYMGDRYTGHGTPDGNYSKYVDDWMAHYLMGVDNGIENSPTIVSETSNYDGPMKYLSSKNEIKTKQVTFYAQEGVVAGPEDDPWKLLTEKPREMPPEFTTDAVFPSAGINTESHSLHHARANHDWRWFESPPLARDVRMFGTPKVQVQLQSNREWITVTPLVADMDPACHTSYAAQPVPEPTCVPETAEGSSATPRMLYSVTRGWLDSRYRNGLAKQQLAEPNQPLGMNIVLNPQDYTFKKGHHIGLMIATEINEWSMPKPYPCPPDPTTADAAAVTSCANVRVLWEKGQTKLTLPLVSPGNPDHLFDIHAGH
jgi:X-Pro dipeptidyl-peptidase